MFKVQFLNVFERKGFTRKERRPSVTRLVLTCVTKKFYILDNFVTHHFLRGGF